MCGCVGSRVACCCFLRVVVLGGGAAAGVLLLACVLLCCSLIRCPRRCCALLLRSKQAHHAWSAKGKGFVVCSCRLLCVSTLLRLRAGGCMRDVGGDGERLTTARACVLVCACFASVCRFQWVSTAGRVAARLLLVGMLLCVALARACLGVKDRSWRGGGPMHCVFVCVCVCVCVLFPVNRGVSWLFCPSFVLVRCLCVVLFFAFSPSVSCLHRFSFTPISVSMASWSA